MLTSNQRLELDAVINAFDPEELILKCQNITPEISTDYRYFDTYVDEGRYHNVIYCPKCGTFTRDGDTRSMCICGNTDLIIKVGSNIMSNQYVVIIRKVNLTEKYFIFEVFLPLYTLTENKNDTSDDFEYLKDLSYKLSSTIQDYHHFYGVFSEKDGLFFETNDHHVVRRNSYRYNSFCNIFKKRRTKIAVVDLDKLLALNINSIDDLYFYIGNSSNKGKSPQTAKRVKIDYLSMDKKNVPPLGTYIDKNLHYCRLTSDFKGIRSYDTYCLNSPGQKLVKSTISIKEETPDFEYECPRCHNKMFFNGLKSIYYNDYVKYELTQQNDLLIRKFTIRSEIDDTDTLNISCNNDSLIFASPEKLRIYRNYAYSNGSRFLPQKINQISFTKGNVIQSKDQIREIIEKSSMKDSGLLEALGYTGEKAIDKVSKFDTSSYLYNLYKKPGLQLLMKNGYSSIVHSIIINDIPIKKAKTVEEILGLEKHTFDLLIETGLNFTKVDTLKEWERRGADKDIINHAIFYKYFDRDVFDNIVIIMDTINRSLTDVIGMAKEKVLKYCYTYEFYFNTYAGYLKAAENLGLDLKNRLITIPSNFTDTCNMITSLSNICNSENVAGDFNYVQTDLEEKGIHLIDDKFEILIHKSLSEFIRDILSSGFLPGIAYNYLKYKMDDLLVGIIGIRAKGEEKTAAFILINLNDKSDFKIAYPYSSNASNELIRVCENLMYSK